MSPRQYLGYRHGHTFWCLFIVFVVAVVRVWYPSRAPLTSSVWRFPKRLHSHHHESEKQRSWTPVAKTRNTIGSLDLLNIQTNNFRPQPCKIDCKYGISLWDASRSHSLSPTIWMGRSIHICYKYCDFSVGPVNKQNQVKMKLSEECFRSWLDVSITRANMLNGTW